jgi:hypothetical protein
MDTFAAFSATGVGTLAKRERLPFRERNKEAPRSSEALGQSAQALRGGVVAGGGVGEGIRVRQKSRVIIWFACCVAVGVGAGVDVVGGEDAGSGGKGFSEFPLPTRKVMLGCKKASAFPGGLASQRSRPLAEA